jgi:osmotically-inducible protein OsmY
MLFCVAACSPAGMISGAVATGGIAVAEERPVRTVLDDLSIKLAVQKKLMDNGGLFPKVSVEVVEGKVLLTGKLRGTGERIACTRLSWSVDSVREVVNMIEIDEPVGASEYVRDIMIAQRLRNRLIGDRDVSSVNYSVESSGRIIYIMGLARSEAELTRVLAHARDVSGVRDVVSYVRLIAPEGPPTAVSSAPAPAPASAPASAVLLTTSK